MNGDELAPQLIAAVTAAVTRADEDFKVGRSSGVRSAVLTAAARHAALDWSRVWIVNAEAAIADIQERSR